MSWHPPISAAMRQDILVAWLDGWPPRHISRAFGVGLSTVQRAHVGVCSPINSNCAAAVARRQQLWLDAFSCGMRVFEIARKWGVSRHSVDRALNKPRPIPGGILAKKYFSHAPLHMSK